MYLLKNILKNITPPFIYSVLRYLLNRKTYKPIWNRFDFEPLKDVEIFFDPNGLWQQKMLSNNYDTYLFQALRHIDLKDKIIFDIGAHIGFHSYYFAKLVGKHGKIYAFEPNKANIERIDLILDRNLDIAKIIEVKEVAISDRTGEEEFTLNKDIESGRSSGNFIKRADTFWERQVYSKKNFIIDLVKTVSLDQIEKELGIKDLPDILKIDVEGAEHMVLIGGKNLIQKKRPIMFIEIHSMLNMYNVITFLNSLNYNIKIINSETNGPCFIETTPKIKKNEGSHNNNI